MNILCEISAYKVFDKIVGYVTADLGGRDQLSAVEATLVESFCGRPKTITPALTDYLADREPAEPEGTPP
jgi:hypothetical protein